MTTVFTGLKPTGQLHLGNYIGAIRGLVSMSHDHQFDRVIVAVVDLHAMTIEHSPTVLRRQTIEMSATLLACGLEPRTHLFVQSQVPAHTELAYLLECTASFGEMARMVAFKEKASAVGGQGSARLSLLTYPTLMAADILAHQGEVVPVGDDQRQHLELTRTLARRFNARYGDVFTVPEPMTPATGARIMDLRDPTVKMGKTNADPSGTIFLADPPAAISAKIRRAVTDADPSLSFDPEGRPGVANLATIAAALSDQPPEQVLGQAQGSKALKDLVIDLVQASVNPIQQRMAEMMDQDPGGVMDFEAATPALVELLRAGRDEVAPKARATVAQARRAMGLLAS